MMYLINLIIMNFAFAQTGLNCLQLEGINIGCITSSTHVCYRNVAVDRDDAECKYGSEFSSHYESDGPIAFQCKSYKTEKICPETCTNPDASCPCTTTSECIEYSTPYCIEKCVSCYKKKVSAGVGIYRGCIICTRDRCSDEPNANLKCPGTYNGMVLTSLPQCAAPTFCPSTAIDPLGKTHTVDVRRHQCPTTEPSPPPPDTTTPKYCPWIEDRRTETGCEPIDLDNRNPKAF